MQSRRNQTNSRGQSSTNSRNQSMGGSRNMSPIMMMIQRCHKWRMKRKQYMDQARLATDEIERERLLQSAEHYGRIVNEEQAKIDSSRDPRDKTQISDVPAAIETGVQSESVENQETDEEQNFPMFLTKLN